MYSVPSVRVSLVPLGRGAACPRQTIHGPRGCLTDKMQLAAGFELLQKVAIFHTCQEAKGRKRLTARWRKDKLTLLQRYLSRTATVKQKRLLRATSVRKEAEQKQSGEVYLLWCFRELPVQQPARNALRILTHVFLVASTATMRAFTFIVRLLSCVYVWRCCYGYGVPDIPGELQKGCRIAIRGPSGCK